MTVKKQSNYVVYEIEFLETKLQELKTYIEDRPFNKLEDRKEWRTTKTGGSMPVVVATIEAQRKDLTSALKEYSEISLIIKKLREDQENEEKFAKGSLDVPMRMRNK